MQFWQCFVYLCFVGAVSFFLGRLIPKTWLNPHAFPFRSFSAEREGKLYERFGIRTWQKKVPDMSRIFKRIMPPKKLTGDIKSQLPDMVRETCVAELIHMGNCIAGLHCLHIWPGAGGTAVMLLFAVVFNLPYIMIQRFNRPRLIKLAQRLHREEGAEAADAAPQMH